MQRIKVKNEVESWWQCKRCGNENKHAFVFTTDHIIKKDHMKIIELKCSYCNYTKEASFSCEFYIFSGSI